MSTDDARRRWEVWREERAEAVSAPYGPLALTGTHWLAEAPEGRIPAIPGRWTPDPGAGSVLLSAAAEDGLTLDGRPLEGRARLRPDGGPAVARVAHGERKLPVLRREGLWAVRVFDPGSPRRRAFAGIDVFDHAVRWALPGRFRPYERERAVLVAHADGRERPLRLSGELVFALGGEEYTLQAGTEADGSLWAVFSDGTSGTAGYRFRFLRLPAPESGRPVTVDFNRAVLPPCAFADHFICPFPPPGNRLPFPVPAGERNPLTR
ncbi:hypothetical protein BLA24_29140 [Streptomyces cinnamoneus]|uniref:Uncharacterized protein n=1 Tax=Streptomyces cinnamoneus TaxID=53446 RepID=A0A2G1XB51_STRCJ|nr:DUF1684 domain-containing protein [Streptomyces cinnamoneus]PHQ48442.1 hypothetical protein BLA24_29140 [Streptomyces cinnamoneus]PPT12562.1 DUF1684 domain-containing protein [Streptomyces cinnamoneus]